MKIAINSRFLNKPHTGIGQYTVNLLKSLSDLDKQNQYFLLVAESSAVKFGKNFQEIVVPEIPFGSAGFKKTFWDQIQMPKQLQKLEVDLVHFLYPSNPRFFLSIPSIVTIHDTIPWRRSEYRHNLLSSCYHFTTRSSLKKASHFITVSATVKKQLLQLLGPLTPVTVIHNAASNTFYEKSSSAEIAKTRKKFQLPDKFILYVGGYDERKNVRTLLDIFASRISPHYQIDLVLAGRKNHDSKLYSSYDYQPAIVGQAKGKIKRIGSVTEEQLRDLYQSCECYVNLSGDEGFNIPLIEAAACGSAIIAADIETHREIIADAALLTKNEDPSDAAEKIIKMLEDQKIRFQFQERARERAKKFSWEESARQTLFLYQKML